MPLTKITRGALTADIIDSTKLADNAVDTEHLADDAVESAEIGENITFTGKYIGLPVFANNAARDHAETGITSPATGMMCFNTAQSAVQQYTGATSGWSDITPAPTFSGFSSGYAVINEDSDVTIKIDGGQFAAGMTVDMVNNANDTNVTNYDGLSYTLVSSAQISISIGAATNNITSGTVVYFNITKGGIAVKTSTITVGADPVWGNLANPFATTWDGVAVSTVLGTLPAATVSTGGDITYSLVSEASTSSNDYAINSSTRVVTVADQAIDWTSGTETDVLVARATGADASQATDLGSINIIVHQYKTTGGAITSYSGYRVHSFINTGDTTFTVLEAITCDILVVGGGGGGGQRGGGGGAGGFRQISSQSLSAGTYTVTVGDGGAGSTASNAKGVNGEDSSISGISLTASGGGGAGSQGNINGADGGSGGGGGGTSSGTNPGGKPSSIGSDLITNGGFSSSSNWTIGQSWGIANGVATSTSGGSYAVLQDITFISGRHYKCGFDVPSYTSGNLYGGPDSGYGGGGPYNDSSKPSLPSTNIGFDWLEGTGGVRSFGLSASGSYLGSIDNISLYMCAGRRGGYSADRAYGGGGGAGDFGANADNNGPAGNGGSGKDNDYRTGSNVTYAAGGGGGAQTENSHTPGDGGSSIGGDGAAGDNDGGVGDTNTGSGGGGGGSGGNGGAGGSGIVVIRYAV